MKTVEIGKHSTPSKILSHTKIKATEIKVSYGGGIGGSSETFYSLFEKNNYHHLLNGETIELNPRFIVYKKQVEIMVLVSDITEFSNHNYRHNYKNHKLTEYLLLEHGINYVINDNAPYKLRTENHMKVLLVLNDIIE